MWVDIIVSSEAQRKLVEDAVADLNVVGLFGALMEVATEKNKPAPVKVGTEQYALRAAWYDGYMDALKDIYNFKERFVLTTETKAALVPEFGATASMLRNKDFNTEEEYKNFTK